MSGEYEHKAALIIAEEERLCRQRTRARLLALQRDVAFRTAVRTGNPILLAVAHRRATDIKRGRGHA